LAQEEYKQSIIQEKSFLFSLMIVNLYRELSKNEKNPILTQLLRSATSIGANVNEASAGQTKRDFITKMAIASKEARETKYWLKLLNEAKWYNYDLSKQLKESEELIRILTAIVKTSQQNIKLNSGKLLRTNH
jgi:four helix bundle protein